MERKEHAMATQEESKDGTPREDAHPAQGDGPGKIGLVSDRHPDAVAPSGVNERDHGAADDKPMGGGAVNLDDDDMVHPRGKVTGKGGTWEAQGGDSGKLGHPAEILSDRNGPSDPAGRK
jgi:hypothetical protein